MSGHILPIFGPSVAGLAIWHMFRQVGVRMADLASKICQKAPKNENFASSLLHNTDVTSRTHLTCVVSLLRSNKYNFNVN